MPGSTIKLKLNLKELNMRLDQEAPKKMFKAANEVRNTVLETLSGPRSGLTYRVPDSSTFYTASAPGEAPASATSELRQSIKSTVEGKGRSVIGKVKASANHALPLEFGTRNMAARPFMKPSFEKALQEVRRILTRKWF